MALQLSTDSTEILNPISGPEVFWSNVIHRPSYLSQFINDTGFVSSAAPVGQVNSDWNAVAGVAMILNKPTIPTLTSQLTNDSGFITSAAIPTLISAFTNDVGYITSAAIIPQVNSDWNSIAGVSQILNKPVLAPVATLGTYASLTGQPTIPTLTSQLTNDSGFITSAAIPTLISAFTNNVGYITSAAIIPQVNSDWNSIAGVSQILNKPVLAPVATLGTYASLTGQPTIPTLTSQLTNNSGFITSAAIPTVVSAFTNDVPYLTSASIAGKEDISNKVISISGASTNVQYPSAKLLYDQLALKQPVGAYLTAADITGKEDISNKVTSISGASTNVEYPSAKLLYDQLALKQPVGAYLTAADITGKEDISNKVTSISGASTDVQYPSAKLLYDQLALKQAVGSYEVTTNKVISISGASTDTQYPSAKLLYDQLALKQPVGAYLTAADIAGKEDISNKVTSISGASTNVQYPSAKLLYDQLALKQAVGSYEVTTNKVISISGASTDVQYPSAKLLYDQLALKQPVGAYLTAADIAGKENISNKVTSISGASTDVQYPSAKLLYDQLQLRQPVGSYEVTSNKVIAISGASTDVQYPSAKLLYDQLALKQPVGAYLTAADIAGKEDISNKVTSISGASTNVQYPSAKLLFDQLALKQPVGSYEVTTNKVITISGASTDVQYPSAKLLYDQLQLKQPTGSYEVTTNKVITISGASTDVQYPSAKLLYDQLQLKQPVGSYEVTTNKVISISALSTDIQYPSAKLLYDQLQLKANVGAYLTLDQTVPQTVINGQATFADGLKLGVTPTVGAFVNGKMFYDINNKTISAMIAGDVTLQLGEEQLVLCYNNTGSTILNGQLVYTTGAVSEFPTIGLAIANSELTSIVLGMATQNILSGQTGLVTSQGIIHDLNTLAYPSGSPIYLSPTVAGAFTLTAPTDPLQYVIRIGRVGISSATVGTVFAKVILNNALTGLSDVIITTPLIDQVIKYNGAGEWINGAQTSVNAGPGTSFYIDDAYVLPPGVGPQTIPIETLSKSPTATAEQIESVAINTTTLLIDRYIYNTALGGTQIDGGTWTFNTYCAVTPTTGISTIPITIRRVVMNATGTLTVTGAGVSRTATVIGGTPFVAGDVNASMLLSGLVQTPNACFRIIGFTSTSVVTVETLATYTNEAGVAYYPHKFLFTMNISADINSTTVVLISTQIVQPAFPIGVTDKLACSYYGTTDGARTVSFYHNGTAHASNFITPLVIRHNDLAGLQGGTSTERYHLSLAQYNWVVANTPP